MLRLGDAALPLVEATLPKLKLGVSSGMSVALMAFQHWEKY